MAFQPKQITKYQASDLAELMGTASIQIIEQALKIIPAIKDGDIIHDNAAGAGAVTEEVLKALPAGANIHIDATDINKAFMESLQAKADQNKWPVSASVMDGWDLTFPKDRFTHSFTTFGGPFFAGDGTGAKQIHNILQPGGLVVVGLWLFLPHLRPVIHAHHHTRGEHVPPSYMLETGCGFGEDALRQDLAAAGFTDIRTFHCGAQLVIHDTRRWSQLAWSYLGPRNEGWTQEDEDKWEDAVEDLVQQLQSGKGLSKNEKGELVMTFEGCIAVAKK